MNPGEKEFRAMKFKKENNCERCARVKITIGLVKKISRLRIKVKEEGKGERG